MNHIEELMKSQKYTKIQENKKEIVLDEYYEII